MLAFLDVTGQDDNLGDAVLRRAVVTELWRSQPDLHVLVGKASDSYVSALGLPEQAVVYRSRPSWNSELGRRLLRQRVNLVLNSGEKRADADVHDVTAKWLAAAGLIRLRGGAVIFTGVGLRASANQHNSGVKGLSRIASLTSWRDAESAHRASSNRVEPDWAFATGSGETHDHGRRTLAITLRGDRDTPTEVWLDHVRSLLSSTGQEAIVFSQVRRDNSMAEVVAARLGCRVDLWSEHENHRDREAHLRRLFARSSAVISDRVHALILGATEGAVPIGLARGSNEKLERTLAGAGLNGFSFTSADANATQQLSASLGRRDEVIMAVANARSRLARLAQEMRAFLA